MIFFGFIIISGICDGNAKNLVKPGGLASFGVKVVINWDVIPQSIKELSFQELWKMFPKKYY